MGDLSASARHGSVRDPVGWIHVIGLAVLAFGIAELFGSITAVVAGLVVGVVAGNIAVLPQRSDAVATFMLKRVLKVAVVLLGAGVDAQTLSSVNMTLLLVIATVVILALTITLLVGRFFGLSSTTSWLIAAGTAICGASAIAAVAPILKARKEDVVLALGTIFLFNAVALLLLPSVAVLYGLDPLLFGTWAGLAVHDTAAAVATGFAYATASGDVATVVKLARTLFLIPLIVVMAVWTSRTDGTASELSRLKLVSKTFPVFVLGFVATATANAMGVLGDVGPTIAAAGRWLIVGVVVSIGLTLQREKIRGVGRSLVITGGVAAVTVTTVSGALVRAVL